jgi:hypothetical protein
MPTFIDAISVLDPARPFGAVREVLEPILQRREFSGSHEIGVLLNEADECDDEELIESSPAEALRRLGEHQSLGGLKLKFHGQRVTIFLHSLTDGTVTAITTSCLSRGYFNDGEFRTAFDSFVHQVHVSAGAKRTICDLELLSPGSFWREEAERLRAGKYDGEYRVDLR